MTDHFSLQVMINAIPKQIFQTWIDSKVHLKITGGNYQVEPVVKGKFSAWDGYISGSFISLESPKRIQMYWRASEFPENSPDSVVEILLSEKGNGTLAILNHSDIPDGLGENYKQGWLDFYLNPLIKHFNVSQQK